MSTPALPPEAWWHVAHLSHVIVPQNLPFPQQYFREKQCSLGAPAQKAAEGLLPAAGSKVRPKQRSSWHSRQQQPSPLSLSLHTTCLRDPLRPAAIEPFLLFAVKHAGQHCIHHAWTVTSKMPGTKTCLPLY